MIASQQIRKIVTLFRKVKLLKNNKKKRSRQIKKEKTVIIYLQQVSEKNKLRTLKQKISPNNSKYNSYKLKNYKFSLQLHSHISH